MGNWNDVSRERRVDRPLEGELKALDSRSCATVVGRVALFPSPSSLEELLPSRIFRIVVEYRGIWVDCPSSSSTTKFIFSLFSSLSLHSFFDKTCESKSNGHSPETLPETFQERNVAITMGGIALEFFQRHPPPREAHSSYQRGGVTSSIESLASRKSAMLSRRWQLVKFLDAWHVISRQAVGGKRRTASFPKRLGLMGGREARSKSISFRSPLRVAFDCRVVIFSREQSTSPSISPRCIIRPICHLFVSTFSYPPEKLRISIAPSFPLFLTRSTLVFDCYSQFRS